MKRDVRNYGIRGLVCAAAGIVCLLFTGCSQSSGDGGNIGGPVVIGVTVSPATATVVKGGTQTFTAEVTGIGVPVRTVIWAVSGGGTGTAISNTGVLTVAAGETATSLTVTATSMMDISKSGTATVTVVAAVLPPPPPSPGEQSIRTLNGVSVPFRYVPDGSFQRDGTAGNVSVITKGYWMGETEVTQELFEAVMGTNPSYFDGSSGGTPAKDTAAGETQNKRPVEMVSWYEAIAFCNKLSLANGKEPVYSVTGVTDWATLPYGNIPISNDTNWDAAIMDATKNGYRLPTEMEWMWAAMGAVRGGAGVSTDGYGKAFAGDDGSNSIDDYAWHYNNSGGRTYEVGKLEANELGFKDMSGNVWEWCWDWYGAYPTGNSPDDYTGPGVGTYRVYRGGACSAFASFCKVAYRDLALANPSYGAYFLGFRVVCGQ
jgi:formylglycine-generating enzyme required for sulfatase activity